MITALRRRLTIAAHDDRGLSLPEILVAMVIFAIISTGVLYSMLSVLALSRDSRAREVALNLAAEEIDITRSIADVFDIADRTRSLDLNGDTFTIVRNEEWVTDPGVDFECGAGGAALRYKRVDVEVSWQNMREPVRTFTVIDPKNRINDPAKGTILVSVLGVSGAGSSGVTVSASPASPADGATAITTAPRPTDADGCSYVLKVTPGNYNVTVSRANSVDVNQRATPSAAVRVTAGTATSVSFQFDEAGIFTAQYAAGVTGTPPIIPNNMVTTFISSFGVHQSTALNADRSREILLHPFTTGYEAIAGAYAAPSQANQGCLAPDPAAWSRVTQGGVTYVGRRAAPAAADPGERASIDVRMGTFTLNVANNRRWVRATTTAGGPGPGCAVPMTYLFGELTPGVNRLALPFGTWQIRTGNSNASQSTTPALGALQVDNSGSPLLAAVLGEVTLDPRVPE